MNCNYLILVDYTEARAEFAVLESEKLNYEGQTRALQETKGKQIDKIDEFYFFESNRWDVILNDKKILQLQLLQKLTLKLM